MLLPAISIAQQNPILEEWNNEQIDSLQLIWHNSTNDTLRMAAARSLAWYYEESNLNSGLYFIEQQEALARKLKLKLWEGDALDNKGYILSVLKNYPASLQAFLEGINILEDKETEKNIWRISIFSKQGDPHVARINGLAWIHQDIALLYRSTGNIQDALSNFYQALKIGESISDYTILSFVNYHLSNLYIRLNKLDSALSFVQKGIHYADIGSFQKYKRNMFVTIGNIYLNKGNYKQAKQYFIEAAWANQQPNNLVGLAYSFLGMGKVYSAIGEKDSSFWYTKRAMEIFQSGNTTAEGLDSAYITLSSIYKLQNNLDSAFYYQSLAMAITNSNNSVEKIKQFQNIGFDQQLKVQALEKEKIENQNKIKMYAMLAGIAIVMLIAFIFYRNNRNRKRANELLLHKNVEIEQQKKNVEQTLTELKSAQAQLIQSEKMASLGELTAGIAHEIQNPLNFVNNFSEVNNELVDEINSENDIDEIKAIANDIKQNSEKILFHGKRADAIVKGMLQHSQTSKGKKEPIDINALADEYLRLSYHGLRAKDNLFNATLKTDFDESIGSINIIPQDIGRVLLNLYNNAFYAMNEKKKTADENYQPTVSVQTKKINDKVEIKVIDNGNGMPQKIADKIFQPFFTTKPTGQGTGLGLSLSYDIIKAHGGEIKVATNESEGAEFIITIPFKQHI